MGVARTIGSSWEMILGEGFLLVQANMISNGQPLYQQVTSTQLLAIPHTPLFVAVCGGLSSIFGSSLVVGRVVALVFGFGICVLIFLLVRKLTKDSVVGVLAGLLVISLFAFRFLGPIYRMDTMGVFLSLAGIYLVTKFEGSRKVYWAIPVFLLAFFTKQYFIAAPLSVCVYFLIKNRKWVPPLKFGGIYLGSLLGSLLLAGLLTNWELVIHNILYLGVGSQMSWTIFVGAVRSLAFRHAPFILAILAYFGYKVYQRRSLTLVDVYFLVSLAVMLATCGKWGAGWHYGLECLVVGCILVGILLNKAFQILGERASSLRKVALSGLVFTLVCLQVLGFPLGQGLVAHRFLDTAEEGNLELTSFHTGETSLFTQCEANPVLLEQNPDWQPWEPAMLFLGNLYKRTDRLGWDQSVVVERLETGYYEVVILEYDLEEVWGGNPGLAFYKPLLSEEVALTILDRYEKEFETEWIGTNWCPYKHYIYRYGE